MLCRATVGECSLSGLQFLVGQVPVGRFGKLSGFKKICGLSGVGQTALSGVHGLCRSGRKACRNHAETCLSGIDACRAAHSLSGAQCCRGLFKSVGFCTLSGLSVKNPCLASISDAVGDGSLSGPCRETWAIGLWCVKRPAQPTTSELVGIKCDQEGTKPCLRPKTSP